MLRRLKKLKFIGKNKKEFYVSLVLTIIGLLISVFSSGHGFAMYYVALISSTCFVLAFFCALNAAQDAEILGWTECILLYTWLFITSVPMLLLLAMIISGILQYLGT